MMGFITKLWELVTAHYRMLGVIMLAIPLGGCPGDAPSTAGVCKLLTSPQYAVLGKTPYDQKWADRTVETIVVGCGQPRPQPRPASWTVGRTYTVGGKTVPVPETPKPKRSILDRLRGR